MTRPLKKPQLVSASQMWLDMICAYRMRNGSPELTLLIKNRRVRFQLAPDGVWRRRIRRKGSNYWRKVNAWDALQCRLAYGSYLKTFPKAPTVVLSDSAKGGRQASPP